MLEELLKYERNAERVNRRLDHSIDRITKRTLRETRKRATRVAVALFGAAVIGIGALTYSRNTTPPIQTEKIDRNSATNVPDDKTETADSVDVVAYKNYPRFYFALDNPSRLVTIENTVDTIPEARVSAYASLEIAGKSADGTKTLLLHSRMQLDGSTETELYLIDVNKNQDGHLHDKYVMKRIAFGRSGARIGSIDAATISANGGRIAYTGRDLRQDGSHVDTINFIDVATNESRLINFGATTISDDGFVTLSDDGRIVMFNNLNDQRGTVYAVDLETKLVREITFDGQIWRSAKIVGEQKDVLAEIHGSRYRIAGLFAISSSFPNGEVIKYKVEKEGQ